MDFLNLALSLIAILVAGVALYLIFDRLSEKDETPNVVYVSQPVEYRTRYIPHHRPMFYGRRMWGPGPRFPRHPRRRPRHGHRRPR
jgi:hypothetical protein